MMGETRVYVRASNMHAWDNDDLYCIVIKKIYPKEKYVLNSKGEWLDWTNRVGERVSDDCIYNCTGGMWMNGDAGDPDMNWINEIKKANKLDDR